MKPFESASRSKLFALILLFPLLFVLVGAGLSIPDLQGKRDTGIFLAKVTEVSSSTCHSKADPALHIPGLPVPEEPGFRLIRFPRQVYDSHFRNISFATFARAPPTITRHC